MENIKNGKESKNTVRVILNVPEELNNTFADLAKKRGLTKSNMIIYSMSWFLDYNKSMDLMPKLIDLVKFDGNNIEIDNK
ncbi:MAG: hypothetical protein KIC60_08475 [Clostridium sp.]|nr:hypothetical protein [Clostridium sp.]